MSKYTIGKHIKDDIYAVIEIPSNIVEQIRAEGIKDCILNSKEYCWQVCCATEHCRECSRLDNGQIDYFDNTFVTYDSSYADMPTTP